MNRRKFLKTVTVAIAGVVTPMSILAIKSKPDFKSSEHLLAREEGLNKLN